MGRAAAGEVKDLRVRRGSNAFDVTSMLYRRRERYVAGPNNLDADAH
jgi:hypothetical protein